MSVGNTWTFLEQNNNRISVGPGKISWTQWSGEIAIKVLEKITSDDSVVYSMQFRDSLHSRYLTQLGGNIVDTFPDTVIEFKFQVLDLNKDTLQISTPSYYYPIRSMFWKHHFEDSLVFDTLYNGISVSRADHMFATYGKDIGMLTCWGCNNGNFQLKEFNQTQYIVSGLAKRNKYQNSPMRFWRHPLFMGGKTWNILGRTVRQFKMEGRSAISNRIH